MPHNVEKPKKIIERLVFYSQSDPNHIFCEEYGGSTLSIRQLDNYTKIIGLWFRSKYSLDYGDIISIKYSNSITFIILFFSIIRMGCTVNPVPAAFKRDELRSTLANIDPKLLICESEEGVDCECDQIVLSADDILGVIRSWNESITNDYNDESRSNTSCVFLSSGSSGIFPKGIAHSNYVLLSTADEFSRRLGFTTKSRHFSFLPFGNTSFIGHTLLPMLAVNGYLLIAKNYLSVSKHSWDIIREYRINFVQVVPPIAQSMCKTFGLAPALSDIELKYVSCGSAPLSSDLQDSFLKVTGIPLVNTYGLSETGAIFFNLPGQYNFDYHSIGTPMEGVKIKIDGSTNIFEDIKGELSVSSNTLFIGYIINGKIVDPGYDNLRYFNTGDIVQYRNHNFYYIGRTDYLLHRAGLNISPEEIERVAKGAGVECLVMSLDKDVYGDILICVYESVHKDPSCEAKILQRIREGLSVVKIPRYLVNYSPFPRTSTSKVSRKVLIEDIKSSRDLYGI